MSCAACKCTTSSHPGKRNPPNRGRTIRRLGRRNPQCSCSLSQHLTSAASLCEPDSLQVSHPRNMSPPDILCKARPAGHRTQRGMCTDSSPRPTLNWPDKPRTSKQTRHPIHQKRSLVDTQHTFPNPRSPCTCLGGTPRTQRHLHRCNLRGSCSPRCRCFPLVPRHVLGSSRTQYRPQRPQLQTTYWPGTHCMSRHLCCL